MRKWFIICLAMAMAGIGLKPPTTVAPANAAVAADSAAVERGDENPANMIVQARLGWQRLPDFRVTKGKTYRVTATGNWKIDPAWGVNYRDADGDQTRGSARCELPGERYGSLICKIGSNGTPFFVGIDKVFTADASGPLYFGPNDSYLPDCLRDNFRFLDLVAKKHRH